MSCKNSAYETESKVDMAKLREAVHKVFAYDPSSSRKDSVDSHTANHRRIAPKGSKRPARS